MASFLFAQIGDGLPWEFYLWAFFGAVALIFVLRLIQILIRAEEKLTRPPHEIPQSPGSKTWRSTKRWLISLGFLGVGAALLYFSPDSVVRGTEIPAGYIPLLIGSVAIFGCLFGVNVFRGGPLDMRNDPRNDLPSRQGSGSKRKP